MSRASCVILTGSPMSSRNVSHPCERHGLQHQLHRFRDRHEVARHFRVRNRDRPARLDLLLEEAEPRCRGCPARCPNRTETYVALVRSAASCTSDSAMSLVAPMTLDG